MWLTIKLDMKVMGMLVLSMRDMLMPHLLCPLLILRSMLGWLNLLHMLIMQILLNLWGLMKHQWQVWTIKRRNMSTIHKGRVCSIGEWVEFFSGGGMTLMYQ